MGYALGKNDNILLRYTREDDLEFIINAEREEDNAPYVDQWTKEQHSDALSQKDLMHLIAEEDISHKIVGYVILAGIQNPNGNMEFKRLVIVDKGRGLGRKTLRLVKKIAFEQLKVHRLWLDVRDKNYRALNLYLSEGFVKEGVLRECVLYKGKYESLIIMSILQKEYVNAAGSFPKLS